MTLFLSVPTKYREVDALTLFKPNQARANEALDRILLASRTGQGVFAKYSVPQECRNYPDNIKTPLDIANFHFVSLIHQSGGNDAEAVFRGHRRMYERWPEIYDARTAVDYSADEIREMMKSVGLSLYKKDTKYSGRRPEWLLHNAAVLNKYWGGDPRNIFKGLPAKATEAWNELRRRTIIKGSPQKLMGQQDKVLALFTHLFVGARLVKVFDVPPPVDIHHGGFFGDLELISHNRRVGPWKELNVFRDLIRAMYVEFAHIRGVTMIEIGEAVWFYSREMCKFAPGSFTTNGKHIGAPKLTLETGKRKLQGKSYSETCGSCFVSDLCKWNRPHNHHYNRGKRQGGFVFVPRPKLRGEKALALDWDAPEVIRCTRHQGKYFSPDKTDGCIGCGECGKPLDLPVRLQTKKKARKKPAKK